MTNTNDSTRRAPTRKQQARAAATLTVVGGSLVVNGQPVAGASFEVTNTNASGPGSLSEAVNLANAVNDFDTITFASGVAGTIDIGAATLDLRYDIDIVGPGADVITLTNTAGDVIYLYNDINFSISGLTIDQAAEQAIAGHNLLSATIDDVEFTDPNNYAMVLYDVGVSIEMSNVSISNPGEGGMWIDGRNGVEFIGPVSVMLTDVDVTNPGDDGIHAQYVDSVEISDSTVASSAAAGIYIEGRPGASPMTVSLSGVEVDAANYGGLVVDDVDTLTISNSTVTDAGGIGIDVTPLVGSATITDTDVSGSGDEGIYIEKDAASVGGTVTVERVDVSDSGRVGVEILGEHSVVLNDVTVTDSGRKGIGLDDNPLDVTMSNVLVSRSVDEGITAAGVVGDIDLDAVTVVSSGQDGMYIAGSNGDVRLTGVTVDDSAESGVRADNVDGSVVITRSTFSNNDVGVEVYDAGPAVIQGTTITGSDSAAILAKNQTELTQVYNVTITQNNVTLSRLIDFDNAPGAIASTTIAGNTMSGPDAVEVLGDGSFVSVRDSIVTGNGGNLGVGSLNGGTANTYFSMVPAGFTGAAATNILADDPVLGPLGNNGGYTETMMPQSGSPALDAGDPVIQGGTDQRGATRRVGPAIDMGSVEVDGGVLAVADVTVSEDAGSVDVTVTRSGTGDLAASVDVATVAGSATAGADFTATTDTMAWADGEIGPKTVSVPILADTVVEGDEQFTVTLSGATGAAVTDAEGVVTITDVATGAFTPLAPKRFADTRPTGMTVDGDSQATGKLAAGGEITVKIADRGDVPADAVGVVMNVTAVQAEAVGFVTVHACEDPRPNASSLNYTPGVNIGNEVIAGLAGDGTVCLYSSEPAHLTVDVVGYVSASSPVVNVVPGRVLDTRAAGDTVDDLNEGGGKTGVGSTTTLKVAGRANVPADAAAVIVNVTAVGPTETGFVTVTPCVSPLPKASSLNHVAGVNRANELVASLDADGQICLFTSSSVHLLVDVVGYLPAGSDVTGVDPARFLDTRAAGETVDEMSQRDGKLEADEEYTLQIAGRGVVPMGAKAVIVNVTAIQADGNGFVTTHPCLDPRPLSSSLNYVPGVNGGNEIVALLSDDGKLCLYTSQAAHLTVDVVAYIA